MAEGSLQHNNNQVKRVLKSLLQKITSTNEDIFDQKVFGVCLSLISNLNHTGFKEACSLVGTSLRDDFSEIDASFVDEKIPLPIPANEPLLPPIQKF